MNKYIIREVPAEWSDLGYYFDGDTFTERAGDYSYNLFIVQDEGWNRFSGYNTDEYRRVRERAEAILDGFDDVRDGARDYDGRRITYKDIMQDNEIGYNPLTCHRLKAWSEHADAHDADDIAEFLSITTGGRWTCTSARGYSQGDYCDVIACAKRYSNPVIYGEIWLGAATEYSVIYIDDDGEETETVYGYIVADSEAWTAEDVKTLVCQQAGIDPAETTLEVIDREITSREYSYRTA